MLHSHLGQTSHDTLGKSTIGVLHFNLDPPPTNNISTHPAYPLDASVDDPLPAKQVQVIPPASCIQRHTTISGYRLFRLDKRIKSSHITHIEMKRRIPTNVHCHVKRASNDHHLDTFAANVVPMSILSHCYSFRPFYVTLIFYF